MCSGTSRAGRRAAFTLLEVVLAVFIMALVGLSIFRFVQSNVQSIAALSEKNADDAALRALVASVQAQLLDLPRWRAGAISGEAFKFDGLPRDEMTWICRAGNGLFTDHASGEWRSTLALRRAGNSKQFDLGLRRAEADARAEDFNWLPLLRDIRALEIRYFDPRINNWLEKWTDPSGRPSLVRLRIWRPTTPEKAPYEAVLKLAPNPNPEAPQ